MLVLTRKEGESIVISNDIKITIGKIRKNQVRLLITAPEEMRVARVAADSPQANAARANRAEPAL